MCKICDRHNREKMEEGMKEIVKLTKKRNLEKYLQNNRSLPSSLKKNLAKIKKRKK